MRPVASDGAGAAVIDDMFASVVRAAAREAELLTEAVSAVRAVAVAASAE